MKTLEKIINYFEENEDVFNDCIEELDSYNGYLGDNRYYWMDELPELIDNNDVIGLLNRAHFGYDKNGSEHSSFNPNRYYFAFNGYGNLISSDYKDYSDFIDEYTVKAMAEDVDEISTIEDNEELSALFNEYIKELEA